MVQDLLAKNVPVKGVNMTRLEVLKAIQEGKPLPADVTHPETWKGGLGAFNVFVDPEAGGVDEYFLTAAGFAAAQWMLTSGGKGVAKYDEKTVAEIAGVPKIWYLTVSVTKYLQDCLIWIWFAGLLTKSNATAGVEIKNDVPLFRGQSLSQSLAILMLESMTADNAAGYYMDVMTLDVAPDGRIVGKQIKTVNGVQTIIARPPEMKGNEYKTITRYLPIKPVQVTPEVGFSSVMDQLLNVEPDNVLYFDKEPTECIQHSVA